MSNHKPHQLSKWTAYKQLHKSAIDKSGCASEHFCLDTFVLATPKQFNCDTFDLLVTVAKEHQANFTSMAHHTPQGLKPEIDPDSLPKNLKDMSHSDCQECKAAFNKEYLGFKEKKALAIVKQPKGAFQGINRKGLQRRELQGGDIQSMHDCAMTIRLYYYKRGLTSGAKASSYWTSTLAY
jgi:hypothetical protein